MSQPFLPADRQVRKQLLLWGLLVAGVGCISLSAVSLYLDHVTALQTAAPQLAAERYARLLRVLGWLHIGVASITGGVVSMLLMRALRTGHFPPPGVRLPWVMRLRTGTAARRAAIVGLVLTGALMLCVIGIGVLMLLLAQSDLGEPPPALRVLLDSPIMREHGQT